METSPPPGTYILVYPRAAVQHHHYLAYTAVPCKKSSPKKEDQIVTNQMEPENRAWCAPSTDSILLNGFADDHSLNKGFRPDHEEEVSTMSELEGTLVNINSWMGENRLKMNNSKTEFLYVASRHQLQSVKSRRLVFVVKMSQEVTLFDCWVLGLTKT